MKKYNRVNILGVELAAADEAAILEHIDNCLKVPEGAKIFTPNAEILYSAQRNKRLMEALKAASLLLPDGIGAFAATRLSGGAGGKRMTGIDTAYAILKRAAALGLSVFLLGGREGIAHKAAERLQGEISGLKICGTHHGYFNKEKDSDENRKVCLKIARAAPDLLFVCFGSPAQEIWICENACGFPSLYLSMALGGSLDVWSGETKRAPLPYRRLGLEWAYRTLNDLSRTPRLLRLAGFSALFIKSKFLPPN